MKNLLRLTLLLIYVATLNSCKKDSDNLPLDNTSKDGVTFHKLVINGNITYVKEVDGQYYYADDMGISERQFNLLKRMANTKLGTIERSTIISDFTKKWTGGVWYYNIQSTRSTEIYQAMSWITAVCNIQFAQRTNQTNYVNIVDNSSASSGSNHIGMESGTKTIQLNPNQGVGTIVHEIMHSLGFFHEHTRPDRDNYINVFWEFIPNDPETEYQYQILPGSQGIGTFDYSSIMLYASNGYMQRKNGTTWGSQRDSISAGDRVGLATLYGGKISGPTNICTDGTFTPSSGTLSIDNASGIATLTNMGNNQWKVTRIGNANGMITLNSTNTYKKVAVGSYNDIIYYGGTTIPGGVNTGLSAEVSDSGATYSWTVAGGIIVSGQGTANVVVRPDVNTFTNVSNNFNITLTYSNTCGTNTILKTLWVPPGGGEGPDPGDGGVL